MACATKTIRFTGSVWSDGTTTNHFIGLVRLIVAKWKKARVSFFLEGSSGSLTVATAGIYANKETDLDTATAVGFPSGTPLTRTADSAFWATQYVDLDTAKQILELGCFVKNTSGPKMEKGLVTLIIDLSE